MASASVGDIYLATMRGNLLSQEVLTTFTYRISTLGVDSPTVDTVYDDLNAALGGAGGVFNKVRLCCPSNYNHFESRMQRIATSRIRAKVYGGTGNGGRAAATSANFAATISRFGENAKRYDQGSIHIPHSGQSTDVTAGSLTSALLTLMDAAGLEMKQSFLPNGAGGYQLDPVIFHRSRLPNFSNVVDWFSQTTSRVMRRRTVGLGI